DAAVDGDDHVENPNNQTSANVEPNQPMEEEPEVANPEREQIVATRFERDPGKRVQILDLPTDQQDEARRFYISEGPYQLELTEYEPCELAHGRRFQSSWFKKFHWLEYSPHTNRAYCLPCFLFSKKPTGKSGSYAFIVNGFQNWKKVNRGKECSFLKHMGDVDSAHNYSVQCFVNLKNEMAQIDNQMLQKKKAMFASGRLRLAATIDCI
ncbi:TTF-type zinc finger protein with HAT dimerisation domain, partial [Striga hermonthica]